ncbi:MAG: response regulator transcription factor [Caldilinea sp.]
MTTQGDSALPSSNTAGDTIAQAMPGRGLNVLIAEDELVMRMLLRQSMQRLGFAVTEAADGEEALAKFTDQRFHLIMLDVLMPKRNGFDVCKEIRRQSDVPIVMITALNRPEDIIHGLEFGADNYITKPFNFRELEARIYAVIRRSSHLNTHRFFDVAQIGDLILYNETQEIELDGKRIVLTPIEFALLQHLAGHPDHPVSKEELLQEVWGYWEGDSLNLVELAVRRLRTKVEPDISNPTRIVTVRGMGYKYCVTPAE